VSLLINLEDHKHFRLWSVAAPVLPARTATTSNKTVTMKNCWSALLNASVLMTRAAANE